MSKSGRKRRPLWQVKVDATLFRFVDDPRTIRIQQNRLREIQLTGLRMTASYKEGTTGGESITKQERYILDEEACREQIAISQERIKLIDKVLRECFSDEERTFIKLFWLDVPIPDRGAVGTRNRMVIHEVGWLADPDDRRRPGDSFWYWRLNIYDKWWHILFPDMPKGEQTGEYIEHIVLEGER